MQIKNTFLNIFFSTKVVQPLVQYLVTIGEGDFRWLINYVFLGEYMDNLISSEEFDKTIANDKNFKSKTNLNKKKQRNTNKTTNVAKKNVPQHKNAGVENKNPQTKKNEHFKSHVLEFVQK